MNPKQVYQFPPVPLAPPSSSSPRCAEEQRGNDRTTLKRSELGSQHSRQPQTLKARTGSTRTNRRRGRKRTQNPCSVVDSRARGKHRSAELTRCLITGVGSAATGSHWSAPPTRQTTMNREASSHEQKNGRPRESTKTEPNQNNSAPNLAQVISMMLVSYPSRIMARTQLKLR